MDPNREALTAPGACETIRPVFLRANNSLKGIKIEPVSHTESDTENNQSYPDTDPSGSMDNDFVIKMEPVTDTDSSTDNESGLTSDPDSWLSVKFEAVTSTVTPTNSQHRDSVGKSDNAIGVGPLRPWEGQETLPSGSRQADVKVSWKDLGIFALL